MRVVKEQLTARGKALAPRKDDAAVAALLTAGQTVVEKIDALEARLHNPGAEVTYDILAERGGARLYSRLSPLLMWVVGGGDAPPTDGMQQVLAEYEREFAPIERDVRAVLDNDVADVNARAKTLGLEHVIR